MSTRREAEKGLSNAITESTFSYLKKLLVKLEDNRKHLSGLGTDYTSGLHDDPAIVRDMQTLDANIDKITLILKNNLVLPLRLDTSQIELGNRIQILFNNEEQTELFRLGTSIDSSYPDDNVSWISSESPLGRELIGKKEGDIVIYKVGEEFRNAQIITILPEK